MFYSTLPFLFLLLAAISLPAAGLRAQTSTPFDESQILRNEALVDYPRTVNFQLELPADMHIVEAELVYDVQQAGCIDVSAQVPVTVDGPVLEWEWVMLRSGNPPPGAELWWEWRLTDDQGQVSQTPRQQLTFGDDRFAWRTVKEGDISLHWYAGEDVGPLLLEAAVDGLDLLEEDLGIELVDDVDIYIYGSTADMQDAVLGINDWAGGVAFTEYNTILIGVPPGLAEGWGQSTIRHELAHLTSAQFGSNCVGGRRPVWLEEGLAMYAEGEPADTVTDDLEIGVRDNSFLPLRSMNNTFPGHGDDAGLAYSQSYSIVQYLREEHGQEKLQNLLLSLAAGESFDAAFESNYGFNVDGLESAWRAWIGAPERDIPPTPTPINAAAVPTVKPLAGPVDYATPAADPVAIPSEEEPVPTGICGLGLLPFGLLGLFIYQSKRTRQLQ